MTKRTRRSTPPPTSTAAQAADVLESVIDAIKQEELAATSEQIARLQGAQAVLLALSQLQDKETDSTSPPERPK